MFDDALPASQLERAKMLEGFLIGRATGDLTNNQDAYSTLRREFIDDPKLGSLLPDFVRINRTLDMFWPFIKSQADNYAERRRIIYGAFTPLMDYLEGKNYAPADNVVSDQLQTFDSAGVHEIWAKALNRRKGDPEGAITVARTLLETVCKRILDEVGIQYTNKEDTVLDGRKILKSCARAAFGGGHQSHPGRRHDGREWPGNAPKQA